MRRFANRHLPIAALVTLTCCTANTPYRARSYSAAPEPALAGMVEYIWPADQHPAGAPMGEGVASDDRPNLTLYPAPGDQPHPAILVLPGGGYGTLAMGHEGHDVGVFCQKHGISAFVLTYRHAPKYHHPVPQMDGQRALRTIRARSAEWRVDPDQIGVMGFSAGGHLASTLATWFDSGKPEDSDPIERASCRPDFAVLVYPVISLDKPWAHEGSKRNLLGDQLADVLLVGRLSTANAVTPNTPPTFLVHSTTDVVVPVENSIDFYLALHRNQVPAELHAYERGNHGFGLGGKDPVLSTWTDRLLAWLRQRGIRVAASRSSTQA